MSDFEVADTNLHSSVGWEDITIGEEYGPYPFLATVEESALAAGIYDVAPGGGEILPPGLLPIYILKALRQAFNGIPPGGVLARHRYRFGQPVRLGEPFTVTVRVHEKYIRRERTYVVLAFLFESASGGSVEVHKYLIWPRREQLGGANGR